MKKGIVGYASVTRNYRLNQWGEWSECAGSGDYLYEVKDVEDVESGVRAVYEKVV